ncbi:hypothetical protein [Desulfoluna sp.]|uniref:hypothetical protein n=1 Tax=Desulfoluna sp. TaxID=2045199 RepID=UPI00261C9C77|nr:hypothetical protein [Desulfoluna sp.]
MIPVAAQLEPALFDDEVRKPGRAWLKKNGIPLDKAPPEPSKLPTYWRNTQKELWTSYEGVCAYICVYFYWSLGAHSTDHFIAKSSHAGQAYEWPNFRLSCMGANRKKNKFDDILDPFEIDPDTFVLNFASGKIKPNPTFSQEVQAKAQATIDRLKLNDPDMRRMRSEHYDEYLRGVPEWKLQKDSPFVWYEAKRQGLL